MNKIGNRMKVLRKQKGISADKLAEEIGVDRSTIFRYEKGEIEKVPIEVVARVAVALQVKPEQLMGLKISPSSIDNIYSQLNEHRQVKVYNYAAKQLSEQNEVHETPLKYLANYQPQNDIIVQSTVSAGTGILDLDPETTETISYRGQVPASYDLALKVSGNSMEPTFKDGDIIFVEKSENPINGAFMVVQVDDEAFIKKVYLEDDKLRLVSLNPDYDDRIADEHNEVRVVGKVVF